MITRIEIDGFKSFLGFSMELRPLTVVLGANAAGKSNLLDALRVFSKIVLEDLPEALQSERGHASELFHRGAAPRDRFSVTLHSGAHGRLEVSCVRRQQHFHTSLLSNNKIGLKSTKELLSKAEWDEFLQAYNRYLMFDDLANSLHHLDPIPRQLRQPGGELGLGDTMIEIGSDGSYLPNALEVLERVDEGEGRTRLDVLQESLARLVPGVRGVEVRYDEEVAEYRLSILTRDGTKLPARLASDGTLRTLALLTALHAPQGGTLCFEEPENGLHPGQLRALIDVLVDRTAATRSPSMQVIATSHSPVVLAALLEARRAAPEQIGLYFMDTARHIPEGATAPSQATTVSRARRIGEEGESGRDVVPWREVERYLHTATIEGAP